MKSRQQEFLPVEYDRPNQDWVCGAEAAGMPCPLGPSHSGSCRAICTPRKIDDRYHCENASESAGACDQGPLEDGSCCQTPAQCAPNKKAGIWVCTRGQCITGPRPDGTCSRVFTGCKPERSLLAKRRLLVLSVFGLAIGGLMMAISSDDWQSFMSPGPLTSHHHAVTDCSACHTAASGNWGRWVDQAVGVSSRHEQSAGCQKCHAEDLGPDAMLAHGISQAQLQALRQSSSRDGDSSGAAAFDVVQISRAGLSSLDQRHDCATCHSEHRGSDFNITHMSDSQCQVCHMSTFGGFNDGHPDFTEFPYVEKSHLYFDHASHYGLHFTDARSSDVVSSSWDCSDCHQPDLAGRSMLLKPYSVTCASCHEDQIHNSLNPGIEFFALPAVDTQSLTGEQSIGQWPAIYPRHVVGEGALSPLTQLMLGLNPDLSRSMQAITELDLADLSAASDEQRQNVAAFVWDFKKALGELLSEGRRGFQRRVALVLGVDSLSADATGRFYDQLVKAQRRWLPRLEEELRRRDEGSDVGDDSGNEEEETPLGAVAEDEIAAGWFLRDLDLSVRYRPTGHADTWVQAWLDSVSAAERHEVGLPDSLASSVSQRAWGDMASVAAPGRCLKCHTAVDHPDGGRTIRWQSRDESSQSGKFTVFNHGPHLTGGNDECRSCHVSNETAVAADTDGLFRSSLVAADWMPNTIGHDFVSDFGRLSIESCTQCHAPSKASNSCLTCHNYHVRP